MTRHPETELLPHLRGELRGEEEESVSRHLRECATCRESREEIRGALEALRAARPISPEPDWRRYRAELRRKLAARSTPRWSWGVPRLVPIAATAAVAAIALLLVLRSSVPESPGGEELPFQEVAIGSHLDMLRDYSVAENLDLLEDLDVVQDLDALSPSSGASSG